MLDPYYLMSMSGDQLQFLAREYRLAQNVTYHRLEKAIRQDPRPFMASVIAHHYATEPVENSMSGSLLETIMGVLVKHTVFGQETLNQSRYQSADAADWSNLSDDLRSQFVEADEPISEAPVEPAVESPAVGLLAVESPAVESPVSESVVTNLVAPRCGPFQVNTIFPPLPSGIESPGPPPPPPPLQTELPGGPPPPPPPPPPDLLADDKPKEEPTAPAQKKASVDLPKPPKNRRPIEDWGETPVVDLNEIQQLNMRIKQLTESLKTITVAPIQICGGGGGGGGGSQLSPDDMQMLLDNMSTGAGKVNPQRQTTRSQSPTRKAVPAAKLKVASPVRTKNSPARKASPVKNSPPKTDATSPEKEKPGSPQPKRKIAAWKPPSANDPAPTISRDDAIKELKQAAAQGRNALKKTETKELDPYIKEEEFAKIKAKLPQPKAVAKLKELRESVKIEVGDALQMQQYEKVEKTINAITAAYDDALAQNDAFALTSDKNGPENAQELCAKITGAWQGLTSVHPNFKIKRGDLLSGQGTKHGYTKEEKQFGAKLKELAAGCQVRVELAQFDRP